MKKSNSLLVCSLLSAALIGCENPSTIPSDENSLTDSFTESETLSSTQESQSEFQSDTLLSQTETLEVSESASVPEYEVNESFDFESLGYKVPQVEKMNKLPAYSPKTFDVSSYKTLSTTTLGDGVELVVANFNLNNGSNVTPYCVVVDLEKANIVAGSYNNTTSVADFTTKSKPVQQAIAWKKANSNKKWYAVTNADFFGSTCVHAFVKDGVILKSSHNYDLNDVPVSKPMLFGVSKAGARIAPISTYEDYNKNLASSLRTKGIFLYSEDGVELGSYDYSSDTGLISNGISVITTLNKKKQVRDGAKIFKFKKIQTDKCKGKEVRGAVVEEVVGETSIRLTDEQYGYLVVGKESVDDINLQVGNYFAVATDTVVSDGGLWDYYDTIIGARHSLLEDGEIPATLAKENSNGTAARVPRTAIGIKDDGKVVIVSVEDLHYSGKATTCTGMTATQLADFMRYFGCYDAANFDGGGSSQLVVNENGSYVVKTKSSDTASSVAESTRSVLNSVIVTSK